MPFENHAIDPVPVPASTPVSLCKVCFEKIRRTPDGWEHFGIGQLFETMEIRG